MKAKLISILKLNEKGLRKLFHVVCRYSNRIVDLLQNNLEKPGEGISVKRGNMHGAMDALEGCIL